MQQNMLPAITEVKYNQAITNIRQFKHLPDRRHTQRLISSKDGETWLSKKANSIPAALYAVRERVYKKLSTDYLLSDIITIILRFQKK